MKPSLAVHCACCGQYSSSILGSSSNFLQPPSTQLERTVLFGLRRMRSSCKSLLPLFGLLSQKVRPSSSMKFCVNLLNLHSEKVGRGSGWLLLCCLHKCVHNLWRKGDTHCVALFRQKRRVPAPRQVSVHCRRVRPRHCENSRIRSVGVSALRSVATKRTRNT